MYTLSADGKVFFGYMNHSGVAMTPPTDDLVHEDMVFLPNKNRGSCSWSPCAMSSKAFKDIPPGSHFGCFLALMIGLVNTSKGLKFCYLRWGYDLSPHKTLKEAFGRNKSDHNVMEALFHRTVHKISIHAVHVRFLTQVAGPSLPQNRLQLCIAQRCGIEYVEMGPSPD